MSWLNSILNSPSLEIVALKSTGTTFTSSYESSLDFWEASLP